MNIYFDNAATTALDNRVLEAMTDVMRDVPGNPSSIHAQGRQARALIERARKTVAQHLNASIGEIFFTSGGTESNNMALKCAVRDLGVTRIITSPIEHHCILHSAEHLAEQGVEVVLLSVDNEGNIDLTELAEQLQSSDQKTLVSLMHANNEIGTLLDIEAVSNLCQEHGALFHSDTVQTVGHFPIDVSKTKINFLSGAAHKFHGPKGVGFIYINGDNIIKPILDGGAQERNMRGGTENIYGIVGLAKALDLAYQELEDRKKAILSVRDYLRAQLEEHFADIRFNGPQNENSLYTVLSVSFPTSDKSDLLLLSLDIAGICASGGSACSSGADKGSHVIESISPSSQRKTIRFSFCHHNTLEEVDYLISKLKTLTPLREMAEV